MYAGMDVAESIVGKGDAIKQAGCDFVIKYVLPWQDGSPGKNWTAEEITECRSNGLKCGIVFEFRKDQSYFNGNQGLADGHTTVALMHALGFPQGQGIGAFAGYDFDIVVTPDVLSYAASFRAAVEAGGYLPGAYGSGRLFNSLQSLGICHYFWLTQSIDFPNYKDWRDKADIVQNLTVPLGLNSDGDEAQNMDSLW